MKKREIKTDGEPSGLTHNPFAALRADGKPAASESKPAPTPSTAASSTAASSDGSSKIVVRREKKGRRGKTVTRVCGLGLANDKLTELQRELKRSLGCGASIEDEEIILQGELTERAAKWLRERLGQSVTVGN